MNELPNDGLLEKVDLWVDGGLSTVDAEELAQQVKSDQVLYSERKLLERLARVLRSERVEVAEGFTEAVMAGLPLRSKSSARAWLVALAAVVLLASLSTAVLSSAGSIDALAPLATVGDFLVSVALVGSGLLTASWQGVGQVVSGWLDESASRVVLASVLVVSVNILLFSLLRRRRHAAQQAEADHDR